MVLVNDNVFTKFGLIQSNHSQDVEQKQNYDGMREYQNDRTMDLQIQYSPNFFQSLAEKGKQQWIEKNECDGINTCTCILKF